MRYKAPEVRHSLDEERQEILEGDMYDLVKYYGQKIGLELKYQEEDFRNDFELNDKYFNIASRMGYCNNLGTEIASTALGSLIQFLTIYSGI
jgi:hypothetical protein